MANRKEFFLNKFMNDFRFTFTFSHTLERRLNKRTERRPGYLSVRFQRIKKAGVCFCVDINNSQSNTFISSRLALNVMHCIKIIHNGL